jgi:hypothetical protein
MDPSRCEFPLYNHLDEENEKIEIRTDKHGLDDIEVKT